MNWGPDGCESDEPYLVIWPGKGKAQGIGQLQHLALRAGQAEDAALGPLREHVAVVEHVPGAVAALGREERRAGGGAEVHVADGDAVIEELEAQVAPLVAVEDLHVQIAGDGAGHTAARGAGVSATDASKK